jgi:hypothetical protein
MTALPDFLTNWPPIEMPANLPYPERAELASNGMKMVVQAVWDWFIRDNVNPDEWISEQEWGRTEQSDGIVMRVHFTRGVEQHHFSMFANWGTNTFWGGNIDDEYPQYRDPVSATLPCSTSAC